MRRYGLFVFAAVVIVSLSSPTYAILDDFEDGNYTSNPVWAIGNPGYTWASVQPDPVRSGNLAVRMHGTEEAHGVLDTSVSAPYGGFDASMEFLTTNASDYSAALEVRNANVSIALGFARDYPQYGHLFPTLSLGEYVAGSDWVNHGVITGNISANTWYKLHMWHDAATGRVHGELSTLEGSLLASVDFLPVTALSSQTISSVRIATEEYTWEYLDNVNLSATPVNAPPIAEAGANLTINSADQSVTIIQGTASDPDSDTLQYRWLEGGVELATWAAVVGGAAPLNLGAIPTFPLGDHVLTLAVSDGTVTTTDTMTLTLLNTPPVGVLNPASLTVEVGSAFTIKATAADFDGDLLTHQWIKGIEVLGSGTIDAPDDGSPVSVPDLVIGANDSRFGLGVHTVDLVLDDPVNGPVTTTATVTVVDSTLPTLSPVSSESILWPPNHELRPVTISANVSDNGGAVTLAATVQSNEPQEDGGDGSTDQDWTTPVIDNVAGTINLDLRAERSGSGEGRIYTITITATDQSGNLSVATVEVRVPHDRKNK